MSQVPIYYQLADDVYIPERWHLRNPVDAQGKILYRWPFCEGKHLDVNEPIIIPVKPRGQPLDYTECGPMYPVIHARVVRLLQELVVPDLQFFPVTVESYPNEYFILNVARLVHCVDEARSGRVVKWTPEDGFPDRVGEYKVVRELRIDPAKVGDARMFRPWGWKVLIVSDDIKETFERERLLGPKFFEV